MKKEEFVKLGLADDLAQKCADASEEELKVFVPKSTLDEANAEKTRLQDAVKDRDKQLEDLKKSGGDAKELEDKIKALQGENETKDKAHAAEVKQLKVNAALTAAKAKNAKAVLALMDLEKVTVEADGALKGFDEQIKALQEAEDSKFLFDAKDQKPHRKGARIGDPTDQDDPGDSDDAVEFAKGLAKSAQADATTSAQQYYFEK